MAQVKSQNLGRAVLMVVKRRPEQKIWHEINFLRGGSVEFRSRQLG